MDLQYMNNMNWTLDRIIRSVRRWSVDHASGRFWCEYRDELGQDQIACWTKEELDAIDSRIAVALKAELPDSFPKEYQLQLRNSHFLWTHPRHVVLTEDDTIYWKSWSSVKELRNDQVAMVFSAFKHVVEPAPGILVASQDLTQKVWLTNWDTLHVYFPDIEKLYRTTQALSMPQAGAMDYMVKNCGLYPRRQSAKSEAPAMVYES